MAKKKKDKPNYKDFEALTKMRLEQAPRLVSGARDEMLLAWAKIKETNRGKDKPEGEGMGEVIYNRLLKYVQVEVYGIKDPSKIKDIGNDTLADTLDAMFDSAMGINKPTLQQFDELKEYSSGLVDALAKKVGETLNKTVDKSWQQKISKIPETDLSRFANYVVDLAGKEGYNIKADKLDSMEKAAGVYMNVLETMQKAQPLADRQKGLEQIIN